MLAKVHSSALQGIDAYPVEVEVEVDLARGLPKFNIVDLPDAAVKEASSYEVDFSEVKGQLHVKRFLEIAAAGSRNILIKTNW